MLLSREELDKSAELHPQIAEFYEKNPRPLPDPDETDDVRADAIHTALSAMSAMILAALGPAPAWLAESRHEIPMRDGFMSELKISKPADAPAPGPLVVLCFGGGFVGGDNDQLTETARALVQLFGASVVNLSYRCAPQYKFPVSHYDSIDSVKWIAENASGSLLHADPSKGFVLGGASAGGCVTASLSRYFQDDKLAHPLSGQWLCIPTVMDVQHCPEKYKPYFISHEQNAVNPALSKEALEMMGRVTGWDATSELRYAVLSKSPISGQPKTYSQVDGMDPLRDEGLIYDEMLKDAGVATKLDFYPGCPHGHLMMMRGTELGYKVNTDTLVGFGWLLDKAITREDAAKALGLEEK